MPQESPVPLAELTSLRLGGTPQRLVVAGTQDELVAAVRAADAEGEPVLVLGGGSNVVVADEGYPGTVVRVATAGVHLDDGGTVTFAAGVDWDEAVRLTVDAGLAGVEALSGIPGCVGGAPIQNIGAYGQEVAQTIQAVRALDRSTGEIVRLDAESCRFTYRSSLFKHSERYVVLAVTFRLTPSAQGRPARYAELARALEVELGEQAPLGDVRAAVLDLRRRKGMVLESDDHDTWSAGSFFTNPVLAREVADRLPSDAPRWPERDGRVKTSAAWLIEQAGFPKGYGCGAVRLSTKHTLALTNRGGGTTAELLALAREIRDGVEQRFGVRLRPEPVLVACTL